MQPDHYINREKDLKRKKLNNKKNLNVIVITLLTMILLFVLYSCYEFQLLKKNVNQSIPEYIKNTYYVYIMLILLIIFIGLLSNIIVNIDKEIQKLNS
jgi:hypothetical protein